MKDKEFLKQILSEQKQFWDDVYPKMNKEEKIKYWLASTHKGMRTQGEAFNDEYSEFSKKWYDVAKQHEPDFDAIFAEAVKGLGFDFDWAEYRKRISS